MFNIKRKKNFFLIIFILITFFVKIFNSNDCGDCDPNSDEEKCICEVENKDCIFYSSDTETSCLYCEGMFTSNQKNYYKIDNSGTTLSCNKIENKQDIGSLILIEGEKILGSICPTDKYLLKNICFSTQPSNTQKIDSTINEYACSNEYYYIENKDNLFEVPYCLPNNCSSEFKYYDGNEKQCLFSPISGKKIKKEQNRETIIFRYTTLCEDQEFEYTIKDTSDNEITYCLDSCPNEAKYYYDNGELKNKCFEKCPKYSNGNICQEECTNKINVDTKKKILICSSSTSCTNEYPYNYNDEYCLKSCQDTLNELIEEEEKRVQTYILNENDNNIRCVSYPYPNPSSSSEDIYYIDQSALKLVKDCSKAISGPYHNATHCKENCEDFVTIDKFECVDSCEREYESGKLYLLDEDNICYKDCPNNLGRGFKNTEKKKCQSCNIPANPSTVVNEKEGYYTNGEEKICYSSCDDISQSGTIYYHNYNDNFCSTVKCKDRETYKYSSSTNEKICYESCSQINDGSEYKFEKDYICYTVDPITDGTSVYYLNDEKNHITKIFNVESECLKTEYKFLRGNLCVKKCNQEEYQILPTETTLGKCIEENDNSFAEKCRYYNKTKICSESCGLFIIEDTDYISSNKINCIDKCPNHLYENGNKCSLKCENKYYKETPVKQCVDQCDYYKIESITDPSEEEKKICVDQCTKDGSKSFYISSGNDKGKCVDSCKTITDYEYSYDTTETHQPCINECPETLPYYYDDENHEKICLKECDKFYRKNNSKLICVEMCNDQDIILPGNICEESQECPETAPFKFKLSSTPLITKCLSSCPTDYPCYKYSTKECVENCNIVVTDNDVEKLNFNNICYEKCPEGLYEDNYNGKCVSNCPNNLFKKNENGNLICISECNYYITTSGECVQNCPIGENFVLNDKYCLTNCNIGNNFFKKKEEIKEDGTNNVLYIIYECLPNIASCKENQDNNKVSIEGTKECIESCGKLYEYELNGTCYSSCINIPGYNFSYINSNGVNNKCISNCQDPLPNFGSNQICLNSCDNIIGNTTIDNNGACVSKCNLQSKYKYLEISNTDSKFHCKLECENSETKRFLSSNYICIKKCEIPNNYVVEDENDVNYNECLNKCPKNKPYMRKNQNQEYICSSVQCTDNEYYYMDTNICMDNCEGEGTLLSYTYNSKKYCVNSCDYFKDKKLYQDDINKKCVEHCNNADNNDNNDNKYIKSNGHCGKCEEKEFYFENGENSYLCLSKCPSGSINDGQICKNCSELDKYVDENGNCVDKCEDTKTGFKYHNLNEYICLNNCSNNLIEDYTCVSSCSGNKPYIYENNCLDVCPISKRFYVGDNKTCLTDCPITSKYYTINEIDSKIFYECQVNCMSYIDNLDSRINAKYCLGEDCKEDYPFYVRDSENNNKICFAKCPDEIQYYVEGNNQNIECLSECGQDYVHYPESDICISTSECDTKKIKLKNKECVNNCSKDDKIFIKDDISFCVDNCTQLALPTIITNVDTDLYLTYDNKCVINCDENSQSIGNQCVCKNLFYFDSITQNKQCISTSYSRCEDFPNYPISINGTKECVDYCNGTLSSSGLECYRTFYNCREDYEKLSTLTNGDKICDCIDKYYYTHSETRKIKNCLKNKENCPLSFSFLIEETKECVNVCPSQKYNLIFGKTCVSNCPFLTEKDENNNICVCKRKYYIDQYNNQVCLEKDCPEEYPLSNGDSNQCLSKCSDDKYLLYNNKTCVDRSDCESIDNREPQTSEGDSLAIKLSINKCRCKYNWYYDETGNEVCPQNNIDCITLTHSKYKYFTSSTKQCVASCSGEYKYEFGNECFKNCDIASSLTQKKLKPLGENKCKCEEYSKYGNNNICLTFDECKNNGYSIINEIEQCYEQESYEKKCPNDYPIFYNGFCYKEEENECPTDTKMNHYTQTCDCKYKWYNQTDISKIICLPKKSNCPSDYPLLIFSTQECKKTNDLNLLEFNYTLYLNCPENTERENNKCICIKNKDWYKEQTLDGKLYYFCALNECPDDKPYKVEGNDNKECLSTCGEKKKYRGICYDKCPDLTEDGNNNECILSPVNNDLTFDNLEQTITEKLLDLYKSSDASNIINSNSSQKIVTKDATVEFYGVNKNNKGNKHQNIQSDLSYIDISECMEKIYKSNGMKNDDDIIILKFDINTAPDKFLINPVEYKFIDSGTGKELDASMCEHNSIKISYPLHDLIQRYDNRRKKRSLEYMKIDLTSNNKDSLREKLDKGKEIVEEYDDTDIFNINDKIYSDICIAVEVDGKDLTLQDRINYFYPEMSICENNCTYNHTDYINERIYCDCSFKKEFDFKREYYPTIEIDTEKVKNDQGGNMNIAVLKCIPNLKYKKSLSGNGGFIFMLIIIVIEFVLLMIIIIIGISSLLNKLKNKMKKEDNEEEDEDVDIEVVSVSNTNQEEKKESEKETQRKLNVPPKRKENYTMEFIPPEYVFLFFNQNEKGVIKKVERNSVPFKTQYNTRILLEKKKNVNYDNIKPRGPFPGDQNILVIVDSMDDSISDYIYDDESEDNGRKNSEQNDLNNNKGTNKKYEPLSSKINKKNKKHSHNNHQKNGDEKYNEKYDQNIKKYKKKIEFSITDYDPSDENYSEIEMDENQEKGFIESIKKEQRLLKKNYEIASQNKNSSNFVIMLFTEIIDKIYITNILLFTRKFDILSLQLSVYVLCHTLLLILLALFYDVKTIEKIWNNDNYPGLGYYLLYGFLACIIIWIIYKIILCLWSNNDKIKEILKLIHINKKYGINNEKMMEKKYNNLACKIKLKIIIYSIIEFLLLAFCFIYFVTFCTVYTGTKDKVFKSYGIALIEILIIKIVYGIVLAILRKISLSKEKKTLYDIVVFMNTYLV